MVIADHEDAACRGATTGSRPDLIDERAEQVVGRPLPAVPDGDPGSDALAA